MSHGGGGGDRWLVSYADFITLLMVLFVVLYAMSNVDVGKYKSLVEGLRRGLSSGSGGGPVAVVDPGINSTGSGTGNTAPAAAGVEQAFPQRPSDTMDVASNLSDLLSQTGLDTGVAVQNNIEGVLLSLSEKLLFEPNTADLSPVAFPTLDKIVEMLKKIDNEVRVAAYTDDTPSTDPRYPTNWELTAARSATIVRYFVSQGLAAERFSAIGRGEFHPVFPNDTPEHKALNRRAEIIVIFTVEKQNFSIGPNSVLAPGGTPTP
jgi:chemotaxis protein MotB